MNKLAYTMILRAAAMLGLVWIFHTGIWAQQPEVSDAAWNKAIQGLDYSKDVPEQPERSRTIQGLPVLSEQPAAISAFWAQFWQILAIGIGVFIVAFGIYHILRAQTVRINSETPVEITFDNLEQHLYESDLERFLREAKQHGNFTQALRIYYLMILKKLAEKKVIEWRPDKTNRSYQKELHNAAYLSDFKWATRQYEQVWFANKSLQVSEFQSLEPAFQQLIQKI